MTYKFLFNEEIRTIDHGEFRAALLRSDLLNSSFIWGEGQSLLVYPPEDRDEYIRPNLMI